MIDPTKTAERQYEAIAQIIEREGVVKDKIVETLAAIISAELWKPIDQSLLDQAVLDYIKAHGKKHGFPEQYTPIPWDAVTTATRKGS